MTPIRWAIAVLAAAAAALGLVMPVTEPSIQEMRGRLPDGRSLGNRELLEDPQAITFTAAKATVTSSHVPYTETVRVDERDEGRRLDRTQVECHGGLADATWGVGNLEPTLPDTGIHIVMLMDGRPVAALLKGSTRGIWNDAPASMRAVLPCPDGSHVFEAELASVAGEWGIPYATNPGGRPALSRPVRRGFIIVERWG